MLNIKEISEVYHISIPELSTKFNIPPRTIQNWVYGTNTPAPYILRMIEHILRLENELEANYKFISQVDKDLELASDLLHDKRFGEAIEIIDNI